MSIRGFATVCLFGLIICNVGNSQVVSVQLREWGPLEPLGPGESGRRLLGTTTIALDKSLSSVEVVHVEHKNDAGKNDAGKKKYFVQVTLAGDGYQQLYDALRKKPKTKSNVNCELMVAGKLQRTPRFGFNNDKTAGFRAVLSETELQEVLLVVGNSRLQGLSDQERQEWIRGIENVERLKQLFHRNPGVDEFKKEIDKLDLEGGFGMRQGGPYGWDQYRVRNATMTVYLWGNLTTSAKLNCQDGTQLELKFIDTPILDLHP